MNILIVAAHPDDEVLGCGGVMARHASAGDNVYVLIVSRGIPELFPEAEIERTREELRRAHELLGVRDVYFLDFPAPRLDVVPEHELADAVGGVLKKLRPEIVYFPHRGDIHVDHKAVYSATLVAARPINGSSVQRLLSYETLSETEWAYPSGDSAFIPTVFVDISAYLDKKLEAMACYESQLKAPPHSRTLKTMEALARFRGATVSVQAAEAFMLVREVVAGK